MNDIQFYSYVSAHLRCSAKWDRSERYAKGGQLHLCLHQQSGEARHCSTVHFLISGSLRPRNLVAKHTLVRIPCQDLRLSSALDSAVYHPHHLNQYFSRTIWTSDLARMIYSSSLPHTTAPPPESPKMKISYEQLELQF